MRGTSITPLRNVTSGVHAVRRTFTFLFAAILALLPETSLAQIPGATLREQLKSLERLHGVEVRGLERIGDEPARPTAAGDLRGQVMNLLRNYNYVVMQSSADQVRGVRILPSQRRGGPDVRPRISALGVQAVAQGKPPLDGQAVHVSLLGLGGREYEMTLAIDLAAKAVVLPAAMKAPSFSTARPRPVPAGCAPRSGSSLRFASAPSPPRTSMSPSLRTTPSVAGPSSARAC